MKKSNKFLACLLGATMLASSVLGGCSNTADTEGAPDYSATEETFRIWSYGQVMDDNYMNKGETYYFYDEDGNKISLQTEERTKWLKDANFNVVFITLFEGSFSKRDADGNTDFSTSEIKAVMDMCHKYGLKTFCHGQEFYSLSNLDNGQSRINEIEAKKLEEQAIKSFKSAKESEYNQIVRDEFTAKFTAEADEKGLTGEDKENYISDRVTSEAVAAEVDKRITELMGKTVTGNYLEKTYKGDNPNIKGGAPTELEYYIWTTMPSASMYFKTMDDFARYAAHCLVDFKDHPAYMGIRIWDEPGYGRFQACSDVCEAYKLADPDGYVQLNMLPMSSSQSIQNLYCENGAKLGMQQSYAEYLKAYKEYFADSLDYYLYDDYPVLESGVLGTYLRCHQMVSEFCAENGLRKCIVQQSYAGDGSHRLCEYEDMLWQANVSMAFGVKEFSYYTYWPIHNSTANLPDETKYPLTRHGERNPLWWHIKDVNHEILFNAKALWNFEYKGVTYYDSEVLPSGKSFLANVIKNDMEKLTNVTYEVKNQQGGLLLVSELYDEANDQYGYYVVNAGDPYYDSEIVATLTFDKYKNAQIYQSEEITNVALKKNAVTIEVGTGRAAFIMPY